MAEENNLARLLRSGRDVLQGASNGIAGNVSGPVDALSWALRKSGIPVNNAIGSSEWMRSNGLTQEPQNKLAGLLGEALGMAGPSVVAAKAPQIAGGLLRMADNAATPSIFNTMTRNQGGGVLSPLPERNYATQDLSEYTPTLYRETNIDQANHFLPGNFSSPRDLWFANEAQHAMGQGANTGVMLEFGAKGVPGQLSMSKPASRLNYEQGNAEFISRAADSQQIGKNLQSVRIDPSQQNGAYFTRLKNNLQSEGWQMSKNADGSLSFTKP